MPQNSFIQKWIETYNQKPNESKIQEEENLKQFLDFIKKTPQQIITESKTLTKKQFKKKYSTHLNSFITNLKNKNLEPNLIREKTNTVQEFFRYARLPLSLGVKGHFNLFLK